MDGNRIRGRGGTRKARVKRKEVQSEDGWTVITHGLSSMSLTKEDDAGSLPSQTVEGLTVEELQEEFERLQERWEDTVLAKQVEGIVREREWGVKEAVCIGIGSFSRDWAHRWRSLWQLVLFVGVVDRRQLTPRSFMCSHNVTQLTRCISKATRSWGGHTTLRPRPSFHNPGHRSPETIQHTRLRLGSGKQNHGEVIRLLAFRRLVPVVAHVLERQVSGVVYRERDTGRLFPLRTDEREEG
jgi:hypothetical protein